MTSSYVTDKELSVILELLTPENRLVCAVCLQTGLRIGDVLTIKTNSLKMRMSVRESKTGKVRRVSISEELYSSLINQAGSVFVFEGRNDPNKHRTRQAVYIDIKRACKALRIPYQISPHSLRKHYAVELSDRYGFDETKKALKHEYDSVTMLYAYADILRERSRYRGKDRAHK